MSEMKKEDAVEFLLVLKDRAGPVHIKNAFGEWTYSAPGFCEAIDMAISALCGAEPAAYKTTAYCPNCGAKINIKTIFGGSFMERKIEPGVYRHFKGNYYEVLCIAQHSESGEQVVVYKALYGNGKIYVRPLEMFASEVDKEKYPNVKQRYRFDRIYHIPKARDMSATCGRLYMTYWTATHIDKTMTQGEFDKWFNENCGQCCYMNETCIKD